MSTMDDFFSFLHDHSVGDPFVVAIVIMTLKIQFVFFLLTIVLDLMCWRTFMKVWRTKPKLYIQSVILNIVNRSLGSVLVGFIASVVFLPETDFGRGLQQQVESMSEDLSAWQKASALQLSPPQKDVQQLFSLGSVGRMLFYMFIWNLFFTSAHRILHTRRFYWLHRFHHQWVEDVLPIVAKANHPVDFFLTFYIPLMVASRMVTQILLSPGMTLLELVVSVTFIGVSGLLNHTPLFHGLSEALPEWLATNRTHLEHHRAPSGNYSGFSINFDWLVAKIRGLPYREQKQQAKKKDKVV